MLLTTVGVQNPTGTGGLRKREPTVYYPDGRVNILVDANGNQRVYTYYGYATKVETNEKQSDGTYKRIQFWVQSIGSLNRDTGATDANNKSEVVDYTGGN